MVRRATASLFLIAVAALAVAPTVAQERIDGNSYSNAKYGIQITKPPSWHFITAGAVVDLAKKAGGAKIAGDDDPVKLAGFAVIASKAPELGRSVKPQVVVLVRELPAPPADLIQTCEGFRSGMTEPETVKPTRRLQLGGTRPAARLDFQGLVDSDMVRATALCTVRDRQAFVVVGQALASEFDTEFSAFESILGSFRLK